MKQLYYILSICIILPLQVFAQQNTCTYQLLLLSPDGKVLPDISLHMHELHRYYKSDSSGVIKIKDLKPGQYHLHVYGEGFRQEAFDLNFYCNKPTDTLIMLPFVHHIEEFTLEESLLKIRENELSLKIELIDADYLRKHGGQTFLNQIDDLPGVNVINTGTGIAKPIIRGFGFNRVAVVDKGIRQEGQQWGWDHGLELDAFDIERAEVIKGPSALIYGSDAVGGVIGIRIPEIPEPGNLQAEALTAWRSVNDLRALSASVRFRTQRWFVRMRITGQDFSDYRIPADSFSYNGYILPVYNNRLKNTAGRERNISATVGYIYNNGYSLLTFSRVEQQAGFFAGAYGLPTHYSMQHDGAYGNIDFPAQNISHTKIIWNNNLNVGNGWLEADLGWQLNNREEISEPAAHGILIPQTNSNIEHAFQLHTLSWNLRYHFGDRKKIAWILGSNGQLQQNRVAGFAYLLPDYEMYQDGIWILGKKSLNEKNHLQFGFRADIAGQNIRKFEQIQYNPQGNPIDTIIQSPDIRRFYFNWSASLGYTREISEQSRIRFNLASSYRLPAVPELAANGIHHGTFRHEQGDSTLKPERGFHADMVYDYHHKKLHISVAPFLYYFDRFIYLNPTGTFSPLPEAGQLYLYTQASTLQGGMEAALDYHFTEDFQGKIWTEAVFTYNFSDGYPLPFVPPAGGGISLEWHPHRGSSWFHHPYLRVFSRFAAPQNLPARNEKPTDGYFVPGLGAGITFQGKYGSVDLTLDVQNLFNSKYFIHVNRYRFLNLPEPGRNISLTALFRLKNKPFSSH